MLPLSVWIPMIEVEEFFLYISQQWWLLSFCVLFCKIFWLTRFYKETNQQTNEWYKKLAQRVTQNNKELHRIKKFSEQVKLSDISILSFVAQCY